MPNSTLLCGEMIMISLKRFDQEMNALREELRMERQEREESQRGKDVIATTKLTIANELQVCHFFVYFLSFAQIEVS